MKKIFILIAVFFLLGISYAKSEVSKAIEDVLRVTNEEQRKGMKEPFEIAEYDYYSAHDNLFSYKIISEEEFEERGIKYAVVEVEITGPNLDDLNRVLTSEYFIKIGTLYKSKENWKAFQIGSVAIEDEDEVGKYYKKQQEIQQIIYKDLENVLKKTKFIKEKKRFELYLTTNGYEDGEWFVYIPQEVGYTLYDPKIEKYLENNINFMDDYDFSSQATFF